jgi:hypothetical protein
MSSWSWYVIQTSYRTHFWKLTYKWRMAKRLYTQVKILLKLCETLNWDRNIPSRSAVEVHGDPLYWHWPDSSYFSFDDSANLSVFNDLTLCLYIIPRHFNLTYWSPPPYLTTNPQPLQSHTRRAASNPIFDVVIGFDTK